jgi:hypothetical protein
MALTFDNSAGQGIAWPTNPTLAGLSAISIVFWANHISTVAYDILTVNDGFPPVLWLRGTLSNLFFLRSRDTTSGDWRMDSGWGTGLHHYAVTYDGSSIANDPLFYVDTVSKALTETVTPAGSLITTPASVHVGAAGISYANAGPNGSIMQLRVYNRVLAPEEITELYNSKSFNRIPYGLVFKPNLNGAAGVQSFGGTSLAAGKTIADSVSGALGVPAGSPVGAADTLLNW